MPTSLPRAALLGALLTAAPLAAPLAAQSPAAARPGLDKITPDAILARTRVLASDAFEGRGPGTRGEDSTVAYLTREFTRLGLAPGNPDGTYVQDVTLVGYTGRGGGSFTAGGRTIALEPLKDVVAVARHAAADNVVRESEVVFVGYGVVAPEYGWNDYAGVDVKGKTVVILINDPPVRRAGAAASDTSERALDPNAFRGRAMTYYGRWTYKYEEATRQGAAAAIIVHETGPAGYPWEVVSGSWGQENFDIRSPGGEPPRVTVEAWITNAKARELLSAAGQDLDALQRAARTKGFRAVPLASTTADLRVQNTVREVRSRNVVARLEGSDPALKAQHVVYSAHWDHFGRDTTRQGDQIFNGALDNASGTAALVNVAEAFVALPQRPKRSLLFLAVTAEERGLLGAKYYAENPLYPLHTTVADINMDGVNQWGRTRDLTVVGLGNSTLDDELRAVLAPSGRVLRPDPEPEKGFFYRSDHFEFAKKGVPALYVDAGVEYVGQAPGYGMKKRDQYEADDYHKPSDEVKPDWDLRGAAEDLRALFLVGWRVANGGTWPAWKPGTEFKAIREQSLRVTKQVR
ncbi:M28 family metallopeptidase [Roseisolibacter sp. H3M3-2]|uniref:M28 family metallopeptidase n=1 Tax=Roseisolibacter sp. H3M3-2 TaxID=3031323 RepID=UPI0023DAB3A5|nr:M28 family metallopeptidase [Roseisolibacter sp. H3M3-2]MDF1503494.1 M28 family metallopeptidase [Roseisolibacter sp. H3M3-2]